MISTLRISNYALISDIRLDFAPGFNVITGETGAGKSIMLGALGLLQGGRLGSRSALHADAPARISAVYDLSEATAAAVAPILAEAGIGGDARVLELTREISPAGRSRSWVNGTPVNLDVLRVLSSHLIDIHSQHNNLLISDPDFQLRTLDAVADNATALTAYRAVYAEYRTALKAYSDRRDEIEATRRDADYLRFQFDRLDLAGLRAGELAELESDRAELAGRVTSGESLVRAASSLVWDDVSAVSAIDAAIAAVEALPEDDELRIQTLDRLRSQRIELADIADTIAASASAVRDDPRDLDAIDERISLLYGLLARHGVETDAELVALRDSLSRRLAELADAANILGELKARAVELKRQAVAAADVVSESRIRAARSLEQQLMEQARPLAMPNIVCHIEVEQGKLNASGRDTVQWLFAFNKNQTPQPVADTASGGEISRVMLVLKCILAGRIGLPTIVFDEIDTGVSGDVASRIGHLMAAGAAGMQIVTITHLPQVAARGERHFKVYKSDDESATHTGISLLDTAARRCEIATMIAGRPDDPAALATADNLLSDK